MSAPFGKVLLAIVAVGLLGHSMWRGVQVVLDPDRHGTDAKGLVVRAGLGVSAVVHFSLALFSLGLVFAMGGSGSSNGSESMAGWLFDKPFGRLLVGAVGLAVAGAGIAHVLKGWHARFDRYLSMPARKQRWAYPVCRFGLVIRGFVLLIVGGLFVTAAVQYDPQAAGGLTDVFATVRDAAYGRVLFLTVAVGLFAFGVYSLIEAVYRRIRVPE